ncbi:TetR/AcrR family transcriptional regulator [Pseudonocardia sp.]|uniref:TetR/AcrR family transcriptional regulator n=1 Tax=Pseudonocardia sp. TaxID=60912 RepID=UPI003D140FF5
MSSSTTADRLVATATRLFAARGVEGVSLREINREAGATNAAAVQYHFRGRDGLLRAILDTHLASVEARRHVMLDGYEAAGVDDLRALTAALVRPYAEKLTQPPQGSAFLQVYAELVNGPNPMLEPGTLDDPGNSLYRWRRAIEPLLEPMAVQLHLRYTAICHTLTELGRRARADRGGDHRLFVSHLVDTTAAILASTPSDETLTLLRDHEPRARRSASPP